MAQHDTLTTRELQIVRLIADGQTDQQIAVHLGIGRRTVSNHVSVILLKLDALRRTDVVSKALRLGLIPVLASAWLGLTPPDACLLDACLLYG